MITVSPSWMVSPGRIAAGSPGLIKTSPTRVPLALPTSSIVSARSPCSDATLILACCRETNLSLGCTPHSAERPTVTTPEEGSGCTQDSPRDMTSSWGRGASVVLSVIIAAPE
jgi:hypothetical protein